MGEENFSPFLLSVLKVANIPATIVSNSGAADKKGRIKKYNKGRTVSNGQDRE